MTIFLPSAPPVPGSTRIRTLSLPNGPSLDLTDYDGTGLYINSIDLGFPTTRDATLQPPTQDGSLDLTKYFGPRTITIQGTALPANGKSRAGNLAGLAPFLTPGVGPILTIATDADIEPVSIQLRATNMSQPLTTPSMAQFQVQWVAPDPVFYGLNTYETDIAALSQPAGITYPITFPITYPVTGGGGIGYGYVNVGGNYPCWPTFRLFGAIQDPIVQLVDTSGNVLAQIPFTNLYVDQGDYIEVNTKARTATLNGEAGASRYSFLDFPNLTWFQLQPGANTVRYTASPGSWAGPGSMVAVFYQNAFINPGVALT